jgi:hypothetical protein
MDGDDRVGVIHRAGEHARELLLAHAGLESGQERLGLRDGRVVLALDAELVERLRVVDFLPELLERVERRFEVRALARERLRLLRVVPEAG